MMHGAIHLLNEICETLDQIDGDLWIPERVS